MALGRSQFSKLTKNAPRTKMGKAKKGKTFPDLNKDGVITKADILKGRGVKGMAKGGIVMKARGGGAATRGLNFVMPKD
tara:strand:- start:31 stop:267 length:237 start_codon:yes stop_codon:yes gene_type:complete